MQKQFEELTDTQWHLICDFLPIGRKRKHDLYSVLCAIMWIVRTGCQWRKLDGKFGLSWQIVYYYFHSWTKLKIISKINDKLVEIERLRQSKNPYPSANAIDSQSIKIAPMIAEDKGIDGGKKINGRKRHIMTDTLGLIVAVMVLSANVSDAKGGCLLLKYFLKENKNKAQSLKCIFADRAYGGAFRKLANNHNLEVIIASKPENAKGFVPVKKRWVVERTFGWFNFFRRLSKDYERSVINSESVILLAQIQILLNRIAA